MKTLMLTHEYPPYPGGVGRYCWELYEAARRQGVDLYVLAPDFGEETTKDDVKVKRFHGGVFKPRGLWKAVSAINALLKEERFERIHIADWPMLLALHWANIPKHIAISMTFHGTDALILSQSRFARLLRVRAACARVKTVFANSAFTMSLVDKHLPELSGAQKMLTPLGVGPQWFDTPPEAWQASARKLAQAEDGDQIVLTVARLDRRKGHQKAIGALAAVPEDRRRRICYLAIGGEVDPGYKAELEVLAKDAGVRAVFAGRQPDEIVRGAYAAASAFLLPAEPDPTRIEGFGLVFLEAAAQGLPSIACKVHAIPEVVTEGENGWLVDAGDQVSMANRIEAALAQGGDPSYRKRCVEYARNFTWERCADLTYKAMKSR